MCLEDNWIQLPDGFENQPDMIRMHKDSILLRYLDDDITIRIEDYDTSDLDELKTYLENSNYTGLIIKILSIIKQAEKVTQIGSRLNISEDIPERFEWDHSCCEVSKFQLRDSYAGLHAKCIGCSERILTIIDFCDKCDQRSIFVKESGNTDDEYECYYCGGDMEYSDAN